MAWGGAQRFGEVGRVGAERTGTSGLVAMLGAVLTRAGWSLWHGAAREGVVSRGEAASHGEGGRDGKVSRERGMSCRSVLMGAGKARVVGWGGTGRQRRGPQWLVAAGRYGERGRGVGSRDGRTWCALESRLDTA
jgi:hypothetical protein